MNKVEYFLTNPEFVRWVKESDRDLEAYWGNWMDANPESLPDLLLAKEIISKVHFNDFIPCEGVKESVLSNILRESDKNPVDSTNDKFMVTKGIWDRLEIWTKVAAILVIALTASALLVYSKIEPTQDVLDETTSQIERKVAKGEKLIIALPDGSRVWLNSGSKISFPERFEENNRMVTLEGEAYFEVEEDALRPFRVLSAGILTEALGTSFNINTKSKNQIKVSLLTGKVNVSVVANQNTVLLFPGNEYRFDAQNGESKVLNFDPEKILAWKEGKIIFENAGLAEVKNELEEWYGVNIELVNSNGVKWKFSGEYQDQTLDNVLNSMSYIEKFNYKINGKNVALRF